MIKPILHRVFVKPEKIEEVDALIARAKAAGIQIELDKREQKANVVGVVVEVGDTCFKEFGTTAEELGIVKGAKVVYAKYSGADVPNTDLLVLNDEDIIGVYTDE